MSEKHHDPPKLLRVMSFTGVALIVLGMLISNPVMPLLLNPRDQLDQRGGIAGTVLIGLMTIVGVVLIGRERTPQPLLRLYYIAFGATAVFVGIVVTYWVIYGTYTGALPLPKTYFGVVKRVGIPIAFLGVGILWMFKAMRRSQWNLAQDEQSN